jgi:hypothetical protein
MLCYAMLRHIMLSYLVVGFSILQDAHRMLAQVHTDKNKVNVYERTEPSLMLRNLAMSTAVQFPCDDVSFTEASFGKQKVILFPHLSMGAMNNCMYVLYCNILVVDDQFAICIYHRKCINMLTKSLSTKLSL